MAILNYTEDDRGHSHVNIVEPRIPGSECEIWCYEDGLGNVVEHSGGGDSLELVHRLDEATVVSRFESVADGVDIRVRVTGPDAESVQAVGTLNPCWQLRKGVAFRNEGDYVADFVSRCFVILERGLVLMKDTRRIPGTRERENDKSNLPEPWIQEYFPVWRRHPGQTPGQRGYSLDRPVYPIAGCVSHDGQFLTAIAWPEARSLGQVWHDCLHPRPAIGESYDAASNRTVSHAKIYFLSNDEPELVQAFHRDFPNWERPAPVDP